MFISHFIPLIDYTACFKQHAGDQHSSEWGPAGGRGRMSPTVNTKSSQEVGQAYWGSVKLGVSRKVWAGRGEPSRAAKDKSVSYPWFRPTWASWRWGIRQRGPGGCPGSVGGVLPQERSAVGTSRGAPEKKDRCQARSQGLSIRREEGCPHWVVKATAPFSAGMSPIFSCLKHSFPLSYV